VGCPAEDKAHVCGMLVYRKKKPPAPKLDHGGCVILFCSKGLRRLTVFPGEPEKISSGLQERRQMDHDSAVTRTWRVEHGLGRANRAGRGLEERKERKERVVPPPEMHPEIIRLCQGSLPICGMALEPVDVFAEMGPDPGTTRCASRFGMMYMSADESLAVVPGFLCFHAWRIARPT